MAKFFELLENGFNTINHILIGFITIYLTFICSQTSMNARSWHVLLCTIGVSLTSRGSATAVVIIEYCHPTHSTSYLWQKAL